MNCFSDEIHSLYTNTFDVKPNKILRFYSQNNLKLCINILLTKNYST